MATERIQIPIDRFGRIVLPKSIRERLGIKAGTEFEVEETEDAILLRPILKEAKIVKKNGIAVLELGQPLDDEMVREMIEKGRRERIERLLK